MSSREARPLRLSPRAEDDIVDILAYTQLTWGERQVDLYLEKVQAALATIAERFTIGHRRDDLPPTHRAYPVGSHIVIYRAMPDEASAEYIGVVRILHQRMSIGRHVQT